MDLSVIIASLAALVLIVISVRLIARNLLKVLVITAVVAVLAIYVFIVFGNADEDINFVEVIKEYDLEDLEALYCIQNMSRTDSLKCFCIVQPLLAEMRSRFSESELKNLRKKRLRYVFELTKAFFDKKSEIKKKLQANNAPHLLRDFGKGLSKKVKN